MFRRLTSNLPEDPSYAANLKSLGYFIDDQDQIKSIKYPDEHFQFFITNNNRCNDVHREAMHLYIGREVSRRLIGLGVPLMFISNISGQPEFTTAKPAAPTPSIPIHCTPLSLLRRKKRILVHVNRANEDLAIWSYRALTRSDGIDRASAVSLVKEVRHRAAARAATSGCDAEDEAPGIVVLNPGQLLFSHKARRAMTTVSWDCLPRKSAVHFAPRVHSEWNRVPGNTTNEEHICCVFEHLLGNPAFVDPDAELYILGLADGGQEVVQLLAREHSQIARIAALALTAPLPVLPSTSSFSLKQENSLVLCFLAERTRAWALSEHPLGTALANPTAADEIAAAADEDASSTTANNEVVLWPMVSGSEALHDEGVIVSARESILDWFETVASQGGCSYKNAELEISEDVKKARFDQVVVDQWDWTG